MRSAETRGNLNFLALIMGGAVLMAAILLSTDPAASVEPGMETAQVAEGPPQFMGVLGQLGRSRGIDLPQ